MLIDAHLHLPVADGCDSLQEKKKELLREMKKNKVDRCIVISDSCKESTIGSLDECVTLFEHVDCVDVAAGISVFFDFDMQLEKIEHYLQNKKIVGIKLFTGHEAFSLADERLEEVYRLAVRYQIPVLFHSGGEGNWYADVKLAAELAGKYSDLKLVCCHCYYPEIEKSLELLAYPNIFFDLSSVADQEILIPDVVKVIRKMAETAPERILFGSDYSGCSQSRHIDLVRELQLTKEEEENIFWKNAEKLYGLRKELR